MTLKNTNSSRKNPEANFFPIRVDILEFTKLYYISRNKSTIIFFQNVLDSSDPEDHPGVRTSEAVLDDPVASFAVNPLVGDLPKTFSECRLPQHMIQVDQRSNRCWSARKYLDWVKNTQVMGDGRKVTSRK